MLVRLVYCFFAVLAFASSVHADPVAAAFPAPDWKQGRIQGGFGFDCVSDRCGRPAQVLLSIAPPSHAFEQNIRDGKFNREIVEKLARARHKGPSDNIRVIEFRVQQNSPFGFQMVYECNCEGSKKFIATRTLASSGQRIMTFISLAPSQKTAAGNMNKMIAAVLRASGSGQ